MKKGLLWHVPSLKERPVRQGVLGVRILACCSPRTSRDMSTWRTMTSDLASTLISFQSVSKEVWVEERVSSLAPSR